MRTAGLFAGIGGIELGLQQAGHTSTLLCEIDSGASAVLAAHFPDTELKSDVRKLRGLPAVDLLAAGFPCQDLSQAGRTAGIKGENSGLIQHVFRLLDSTTTPTWLLLENVPFMLHLERGKAMRYLVDELESRGFTWAYRVVDTRAFGLPQRRQRVILLASKSEDPRAVLFADDTGQDPSPFFPELWCGFYWTEGSRGLGWAIDSIPTLKGGSSIGIPSPPAVWAPWEGWLKTPDLRDAERLQGFPVDWTAPALEQPSARRAIRWKLIGNAVSVPVARWLGLRLNCPVGSAPQGSLLSRGVGWPKAAWGHKGKVFTVDRTMWPVKWDTDHLSEFLKFPLAPLSQRATAGFLRRAESSSLTFEPGFLDAVRSHLKAMSTTRTL